MTSDETRLIPLGEQAEARATAHSRGTYPRHEPGRFLEVDEIANEATRSADRLKLAFLIALLVAFLVIVIATGALR